MKKIIPALLLTLVFSSAFTQTEEEENCYYQYAKVFEKRGAEEVADGTYDNVIITLRHRTMADCFYGKVTVKNGTIDYYNIYLTFEDGTHEKLEYKFKYTAKPIKVVNGISNVILTEDEQLINILFIEKIKPKKKRYKKAAIPNYDL